MADYSENKPIWPGSSSFVAGDTPFGFFDADTSFQTEADSFAKGESFDVRAMVFTPLLLATLAVLTISAVLPVNDMRTSMSSVFIIETIIL